MIGSFRCQNCGQDLGPGGGVFCPECEVLLNKERRAKLKQEREERLAGAVDPGNCIGCGGSGSCSTCRGSGWTGEPKPGSPGLGCLVCREADWPLDRRGTGQCAVCKGTGKP